MASQEKQNEAGLII